MGSFGRLTTNNTKGEPSQDNKKTILPGDRIVVFVAVIKKWSERRDLNPRQPPWQGGALPLSYARPIANDAAQYAKKQKAKQVVFSIIFKLITKRHTQ